MLCVICDNDNVIERVYSFKLLGVVIEYNLKWNAHVDLIRTKASTRLHFLKVLKRSSLSKESLFLFIGRSPSVRICMSCVAYKFNYKQQTRQIESIQKRAFRIIFNSDCLDYNNFRIIHQLQTLAERRDELCKSFSVKS